MVEVVSGVLFGVAFFGAFAFWLVAFVNMFRAAANRKENEPLFPNWFEGPFNVIYRPDRLTERGLVARRRVFIGAVGFFVCWLIAVAAAVLAGFE